MINPRSSQLTPTETTHFMYPEWRFLGSCGIFGDICSKEKHASSFFGPNFPEDFTFSDLIPPLEKDAICDRSSGVIYVLDSDSALAIVPNVFL